MLLEKIVKLCLFVMMFLTFIPLILFAILHMYTQMKFEWDIDDVPKKKEDK